MAVYQSSAFGLFSLPEKYPNLISIPTNDFNRRCEDRNPTSINGIGCIGLEVNNLKSYTSPEFSFTFDHFIMPILLSTNTNLISSVPESNKLENKATTLSPIEMVAQLTQPVKIGGMSAVEIVTGEMTASDKFTGTFQVDAAGTSQIHLAWADELITLSLSDPDGHLVSTNDPGLVVITTTLGIGWTTIYHFVDIKPGIWKYEIHGQNLTQMTAFQLYLFPTSVVSLTGNLPEWKENGSSVLITATVFANGTTPLNGATVSAVMNPPDGKKEVLIFFDDGNHGDGVMNDGIYGAIYTNTLMGGLYFVKFTASGTYNNEVYLRHASGSMFIASANAQVGTNFTDRGIDNNFDGLFESLGITIPITVSVAGRFTVSAEIFANIKYIGFAKFTVDLKPGVHLVGLRFSSATIYDSKENGPFTLHNLMLLDETTTTNLAQIIDPLYQTKAYLFEKFKTHGSVYIPFMASNLLFPIAQQDSNNINLVRGGVYTVLTDENGYFVLTDIPSGSYSFMPEEVGKIFTPRSVYSALPWGFTYFNFIGHAMVLIPAGHFSMGCDSQHSSYSCVYDEQPLHTIYLDAYRIDKTEVTNSQYSQCVSIGYCTPPGSKSSSTRSFYFGNSNYSNYPVIYVSQGQASTYCSWVGKRLPTEAQWEKAAHGVGVQVFPWGNTEPTCAMTNADLGISCKGDTTAVGSFLSGASPYGVLDMAGNVVEWVSDQYSSNYYSAYPTTDWPNNPFGPNNGSGYVLRGGSFTSNEDLLRVVRRSSAEFYLQTNFIGFRCVANP